MTVKLNWSSFDLLMLVSEPLLELLDSYISNTLNEFVVISLVCSAGVIGFGPLVITSNDCHCLSLGCLFGSLTVVVNDCCCSLKSIADISCDTSTSTFDFSVPSSIFSAFSA